MASLNYFLLSSFLFLISFSTPVAPQSFRPKTLVIPVSKDDSTLQYITTINQRTPSIAIDLVLDLGGQFLWVDCDKNYASSTYQPARCRSAQCSLAKTSGCGDCFAGPKPGCNNNTCGVFPDNSVTRTATSGEVAQDVVSVDSTNGSNPGRVVTVPKFLFSCGANFLLEGLASGVVGMAGLGRTKIALPSQFAAAFSFNRKFAICLSRSTNSNGVVFFGDGPYSFLPGIDMSQSLTYTPLFLNPVSTASAFTSGEPSAEYFIGVKSIKIDDAQVKINTTLLSIDQNGVGGTKISTINPYTVLETSIYKAVTQAFIQRAAARNITRVAGSGRFDTCFSSANIGSTRLGAAVPTIQLVLQNENVVWSIFGANSMVQVSDGVLCLAVVDGGAASRTSIVIGGYQLEDNLVQFDLATSRMGFSSTLLGRMTTCANFNFTSIA